MLTRQERESAREREHAMVKHSEKLGAQVVVLIGDTEADKVSYIPKRLLENKSGDY